MAHPDSVLAHPSLCTGICWVTTLVVSVLSIWARQYTLSMYDDSTYRALIMTMSRLWLFSITARSCHDEDPSWENFVLGHVSSELGLIIMDRSCQGEALSLAKSCHDEVSSLAMSHHVVGPIISQVLSRRSSCNGKVLSLSGSRPWTCIVMSMPCLWVSSLDGYCHVQVSSPHCDGTSPWQKKNLEADKTWPMLSFTVTWLGRGQSFIVMGHACDETYPRSRPLHDD